MLLDNLFCCVLGGITDLVRKKDLFYKKKTDKKTLIDSLLVKNVIKH